MASQILPGTKQTKIYWHLKFLGKKRSKVNLLRNHIKDIVSQWTTLSGDIQTQVARAFVETAVYT